MSVALASATTARYVTDSAPGVETRYRARFYFDPNSTTMANNADHVVFYGDSGTTPVLQLDLGYTTAGGYRLRTRIRDNSSTWNNSAWVNVSDAPHKHRAGLAVGDFRQPGLVDRRGDPAGAQPHQQQQPPHRPGSHGGGGQRGLHHQRHAVLRRL
jgi:hypothetical protein